MADKATKKRVNWKQVALVAKVSVFWILVAGVIVLVQNVDKSAEKRGQLEGYTKAASTIQSLCK